MSTFREQIELKLMLSLHVSLSLRIGLFNNPKEDEIIPSTCHNQGAGSDKTICVAHKEELELIPEERPPGCDRLADEALGAAGCRFLLLHSDISPPY